MAHKNSHTSGLGAILIRLDRGTELVESFILSTSVLLMAALSVLNVITRNVFNNSLAFTQESNAILLVLITFVGVGYGARHGRHIRMSAFHDMFSEKGRRVILIVVTFLTGALLFYLAWYALVYTMQTFQRGPVTPAMRVPLWIVYAWVPFGLVIGGIQFWLATAKNLMSTGAYLSFSKTDEMEEEDTGAAAL